MAIKRYVGFGKETTYGAAVAASRYAEALCNMKPDLNWVIPLSIAQRASQKKNLGPFRSRGGIRDMPVEPENIIGELLYGVLGSVSTTNPYAGVYKHTFSPADDLPSYTMRKGVEIIERIIPGCLIEALTVRFPHDKDLGASAEVYSGFDEGGASLASPTFSPLQALNMQNTDAILTIGGVNKRNVVYDLEVTIKNNIPFDRGALDGRFFTKKRFGQRDVTGKISLYFDDSTERDRFLIGQEFALIVHAVGPMIASTYPYYFKLDLRKCVYLRDVAPDITPISEPLVVDAPFKAFYDTTGGWNAEIKAELQNTITTY